MVASGEGMGSPGLGWDRKASRSGAHFVSGDPDACSASSLSRYSFHFPIASPARIIISLTGMTSDKFASFSCCQTSISYAPVTSTDAEDTGSSNVLSNFSLDASSVAEDWFDPPL